MEASSHFQLSRRLGRRWSWLHDCTLATNSNSEAFRAAPEILTLMRRRGGGAIGEEERTGSQHRIPVWARGDDARWSSLKGDEGGWLSTSSPGSRLRLGHGEANSTAMTLALLPPPQTNGASARRLCPVWSWKTAQTQQNTTGNVFTALFLFTCEIKSEPLATIFRFYQSSHRGNAAAHQQQQPGLRDPSAAKSRPVFFQKEGSDWAWQGRIAQTRSHTTNTATVSCSQRRGWGLGLGGGMKKKTKKPHGCVSAALLWKSGSRSVRRSEGQDEQRSRKKSAQAPPVTMATDKEGRRCRAEREEGKERAAGKKGAPPSFVSRPSWT